MIDVLVPSFRDDMLERLFRSMHQSERYSLDRVTVLDNGLSEAFKQRWSTGRLTQFIPVPNNPFVFAQAYNIGVAETTHDVVSICDDVEIMSDMWVSRLTELAINWPVEYGILSLAETTTSSVYGKDPGPDDLIDLPDVALGAGIIIPRRVLHDIGPWDAGLVGYGFDDFDYGVRCYHSGLKLGITGAALLSNKEQASAWVRRLGSYDAVLAKQDVNFAHYHLKWYGALPVRPWIVHRPSEEEHFNRRACRCVVVEESNAQA